VFVGRAPLNALESDPGFFLRHGYTYSGHASVCAAGLRNLEIMERENLVDRAAHVGARLGAGLQALAADGIIDHARGEGAVWAAGLKPDQNATFIRDHMLRNGAIVRALNTDTTTFCPPLVITDAQLDRLLDIFASAATATS
jgi:adenosylmethionine-8-amino-7-oxononanoate aminotransferase